MSFVQRREGLVIGVYANPQPGYAEEELADDHPDIVTYNKNPAMADTASRINSAPATLFGGPTLGEIFHGH